MGFQLWISPNTGIRRNGTTFKELQDIYINKITTKFIFEPIYCCRVHDNANDVRDELSHRDFDVIGVINEMEQVFGYAIREDLEGISIEEHTQIIELANLTSDSTPILELLTILSATPYVFVMVSNKIVGIVTRADINKPIVRMYLFGIITLFELHLNFWINRYYSEDSWQKILHNKRLNAANSTYEKRKGANEELTLLECLQLCDKRDILNNTNDFRTEFNFSKNQFERLLKDAEKIRNELAHSQNSITANLEWGRFASTISELESFLHSSERIVENLTRTHNPL